MAPVAQPRNIIFGQCLATTIALLFSLVSEDYLSRSLRISLATATAIAAKVLLGIAHPPAGATALIVSSGGFDWTVLLGVIVSNTIAIVLSTAINNISEKRQYPTYYRVGESFLAKAIFGCCVPEGDLTFVGVDNERVIIKRAWSLLKEANFQQNDDETTQKSSIQNYILSRKPLDRVENESDHRSSSTSLRSYEVSITGDEEYGDSGLNLVNEISSPTLYAPNMTNEKVMTPRISKNNPDTIQLPDSPSQNRALMTFLSPLEEEDQPDRKPTVHAHYDRYRLTYGSMFMVPTLGEHSSLNQGGLNREESNGDLSSMQSELEDIF